jgi:ceramide glucosyltransferase
MIRHALEIVGALGTLSSLAYSALCLWSAVKFLRQRKSAGEEPVRLRSGQVRTTQPELPVSILKPLKGTDPEMYESLRSHCMQEYEEYEIIFGVSESADPAAKIVERLKLDFPQRAIRLLVCEKNLGPNTKVSNLAQMLPRSKYEYLLVNDSDIRVEPDYLRRVVAPLSDKSVGMVTCLYRGVASPTLGSRLEMLGISTDFCAGVLAARQLEGGLHFAVGSTLAFRRSDLEAIGGFEAFVDYLADDYEMGSHIAARGLEVKLSDAVVETLLPPYSLRGFLQHQLRWARTVRDSRRWGYVGLVFTFLLPWVLLTLVSAKGAPWAWGLFALACAVRLLTALVVGGGVLHDRQVKRWIWLIPLRDVVAVLVWLGSFAGRSVVWRGDYFYLKDGKLVRINQ